MRSSDVIDIAYKTIKKYNMFQIGDKVVVGVSGGPDSLCLLQILYKLKDKLSINLYVAHINHGLRGVCADEDERFVRNLAQDIDLPIFTIHIDIKIYAKENRMTLEEAGREVRYKYFYEIITRVNGNKIAVGHNMNDNAETLLLNLLRGSGMDGLKGIEPKRGSIVRPLIKIKREEIELYCKENGLNPRIDESNAETIFTRNKLRLELIPYLKDKFNPNIIDSFGRTAELIADENALMHSLTEEYYSKCLVDSQKDIIRFSLEAFNKCHGALKRRILRMSLENIRGNLKAIEKIHIDQVIELAGNKKNGTWVKIPINIIVKIEYNQLIIMLETIRKEICYSYAIPVLGEIRVSETGGKLISKILSADEVRTIKTSKALCMLDYSKIDASIFIRNRRNGDIINPSGMQGTKKLKDYFIDEKVPREQRECTPLIAVGNEIIWVIGKRYSEKYKVNNQTKEVLVLEYEAGE